MENANKTEKTKHNKIKTNKNGNGKHKTNEINTKQKQIN